MAQKYKVKKGDNLSSIAKQFGVGISDITGYRSGNPDLIFEGEELLFSQPKTSDPLVDELSKPIEKDEKTQAPETKSSYLTDSVYGEDIKKYKTQLDDLAKKKEDLYSTLQNYEQNTYQSLYDEAGLGSLKERIAQRDADIAQKKQEYNDTIARLRSNPGASAATITGEVSVATDKLKGEIENLVNERNSIAEEYNTGVSEIKNRVNQGLADLERQYNYYDSLEQQARQTLSEYQNALLEELATQQEREYEEGILEKELANDLILARTKGSDDLLSYTEAASLGLPFGTTVSQASSLGIIPKSQLTGKDKIDLEVKLANDFERYAKEGRAAERNIGTIDTGYQQALNVLEKGESLNAPSQAMLVTFQKMLDPTSVVRESEYARSGAGQSLANMIEGQYQKLVQGGAGVTIDDLKSFRDMSVTLLENYRDQLMQFANRIKTQAENYGLEIENILTPDIIQMFNNQGNNKSNDNTIALADELAQNIVYYRDANNYGTRENLISTLAEYYPEFTQEQIAQMVYGIIPDNYYK